jgi:ATP-dependent DNA helicase RecQ
MIVEDGDFPDVDEEEPQSGGINSVLDQELYVALKDLRAKKAKQKNLPPYVIFQDVSIEQMATMYPITIEELKNIQGVGDGKAKRYGKEFLDVIKKHCEDNQIERPAELRVRTVAKKSILKVKIIHSIDLQTPLDDVANNLNIEFEDLLSEIEAIVYSGTKINIDYFLDEVVDDDHIDDIYEYFRESETDSLDVAMDELGDDYSEDEVRLVRIKFLSEMAN